MGSPTGLIFQIAESQILIRDHTELQQKGVLEGEHAACSFSSIATSADGAFIAAGCGSKKGVSTACSAHDCKY